MASIENFVANEYVAACWGVACSIDPANTYDQYTTGVDHRSDHCGTETNQHIYTNSNNTPVSMIEEGTDGLGNLTCELYTNSQYSRKKILPKLNQEIIFIGLQRLMTVEFGIIKDMLNRLILIDQTTLNLILTSQTVSKYFASRFSYQFLSCISHQSPI